MSGEETSEAPSGKLHVVAADGAEIVVELRAGPEHPNHLCGHVEFSGGHYEGIVQTVMSRWEVNRFSAAILLAERNSSGAAELASDSDDLSLRVSHEDGAWRVGFGFDLDELPGFVRFRFALAEAEFAPVLMQAGQLARTFPVVPIE